MPDSQWRTRGDDGQPVNIEWRKAAKDAMVVPATDWVIAVSPDRYANLEAYAKANGCSIEQAYNETLGLKTSPPVPGMKPAPTLVIPMSGTVPDEPYGVQILGVKDA